MKKATLAIAVVITICISAQVSRSQNPSGGPYELMQSVIAGGGGESIGGPYSVTETIGQHLAGGNSTGSPFGVRGGFWQSADLAPTAAGVSVTGRVVTAGGVSIPRCIVTLVGARGDLKTAMTNGFGYFRFDDVEAGQVYILDARSKLFQFVPRAISVDDEIADLEVMALP